MIPMPVAPVSHDGRPRTASRDEPRSVTEPLALYLRDLRAGNVPTRAEQVAAGKALQAARRRFAIAAIVVPYVQDGALLAVEHVVHTGQLSDVAIAGSDIPGLTLIRITQEAHALAGCRRQRHAAQRRAARRGRLVRLLGELPLRGDFLIARLNPARAVVGELTRLQSLLDRAPAHERRRRTREYTETAGRAGLRPAELLAAWPRITAAEDAYLAARDHFASAHLRFVVYRARRYRSWGVPLDDVVQFGNLGLLHAVEKWDPDHGTSFATYAAWWIDQAIVRGIADSAATIRVPLHLHGVRRAALGEATGTAAPEIETLAARHGLSAAQVRTALRSPRGTVSVEEALEGDDLRLADALADVATPLPHRVAEQKLVREHLARALQTLPVTEQQVVRLRYGLDDGVEHTLDAIGDALGLTRARVATSLRRAFASLRPQCAPLR